MIEINSSIIIAGRICSGKSTLAKAISNDKEIPIASFGGYLVNYCNENGIEIISRDTLQDLGDQFVKTNHSKFLDDVIKFSTQNPAKLIFEGVRHKAVLSNILNQSKKCFAIFIDVPQEERYRRIIERKKDTDRVRNLQDFIKLDNHPVEREIEELKNRADLMIKPNYDLAEILKRISHI